MALAQYVKRWLTSLRLRRTAGGTAAAYRPSLESLESRDLMSAAPVFSRLIVPPTAVAALRHTPPPLTAAYINLPSFFDLRHPGPSAPAQHLVIRSGADLVADTGLATWQLAADLNVPSIDWNTQMIVLVSQGFGTYTGSSPKAVITGLDVSQGRLTVQWNLILPDPNLKLFAPLPMRVDPAEVVLTTNYSGTVVFHQNPNLTWHLPPPALAASLNPRG
jgi:hypothetical protein